MKRAAWRSIQDTRAAVRYFKHKHALYQIDTTQIYLIGNSAGAITALHTAFMNPDTWIPEAGNQGYGENNTDLGCLDCSTSLSEKEYNHSSEVAAVISLWGATMNLDYFKAEKQIPTMLVHGTADNIVPYGEGSAFNFGTGFDITFTLHGSLQIHEKMLSENIPHVFYPYENQPHCFYSCGNINLATFERDSFPCEFWTPIFYDGINFLASVNPYTKVNNIRADYMDKPEISIYPNPEEDYIHISTNFKSGIFYHIEIFNSIGEKIKDIWNDTKDLKIDSKKIPEGIYLVQISNRNKKQVKKLIIEH
jgi:dienelactone hydrolase